MIDASQIKQSLGTMKSMNSSFYALAKNSINPEEKGAYHEAIIMTEEIIADLKSRLKEIE